MRIERREIGIQDGRGAIDRRVDHADMLHSRPGVMKGVLRCRERRSRATLRLPPANDKSISPPRFSRAVAPYAAGRADRALGRVLHRSPLRKDAFDRVAEHEDDGGHAATPMIAAIIRKKLTLSMLLHRVPRMPASRLPGLDVARNTAIMKPAIWGGAALA